MINLNHKNAEKVTVVKVNSSAVDIKANVNKVQPKDSFAYSFRSIYYYSRVFGLLPYSIIYDTEGEPQVPRVGVLNCLWFIVSIFLYSSMAYVSYIDMSISHDQNVPHVLVLGSYFLQILSLIFGAVIIIMDMCNRHRFVDILRKIGIFDKEAS